MATACLALGATLGPALAGGAKKVTSGAKQVIVANKPSKAVPTKAKGTTKVGGTVDVGNLPQTQQVGGTVDVANLPVEAGRVATAPAVPAEPLHREAQVDAVSASAVGAPVAQGKNVAISSVQAMAVGGTGGGWSILMWRKASTSGECDTQGAQVAIVANFRLMGHQGAETPNTQYAHAFPVPQVTKPTDRALCLWAHAAPGLAIVVDGFTY